MYGDSHPHFFTHWTVSGTYLNWFPRTDLPINVKYTHVLMHDHICNRGMDMEKPGATTWNAQVS
jgi:hypothetical protein